MRIVFVLRQSPDWRKLAADFALGKLVAPTRDIPAHDVPTFPERIDQSVAHWNAAFKVDFFACRAELQILARDTLDAVAQATVLTLDDLPHRLPTGDFRLFFLDDDDWFAPDTAARLADVVGAEDVAVFPLLRLDAPTFTFVRQETPASPIIGFPNDFSHRYQTNNYAIHPRLCQPARLAALVDHMTASAEADRLGLCDAYHEVMVSVTNKTPVSASVIGGLLQGEAAFRHHVEAFVAALHGITLPPHAAWMRGPIERTSRLFSRALGVGI
jgi:hypothetical protein